LSRFEVSGVRRKRTPVASVGAGGGDRTDRALARTRGRQFKAVDQSDVDCFGGPR
jgi:hypothetical protein